jgi:3-methyladenine DNA glycosylase AlkD
MTPDEMKTDGILGRLEALGHENVRKLNSRNGAGENQFGVKLGDLRSLAKTIKTNHDLAMDLWQTGSGDAMLLSTLLLRPAQISSDGLEQMLRVATYVQLSDWLATHVVKLHPDKETLQQKWMASNEVMLARAGWMLTASRVNRAPEGLDLNALLDRIEAQMGSAPAQVQWTMNNTLAAIGIHFAKHRTRAVAIGEKLGVFRDYPTPKGCTSPFAPIWIAAIVGRQK